MKLKLLLLFLCLSSAVSAQVAVRGFQFRPIGDYGFVLNKSIGFGAMYMGHFEDDSPFRMRAGISYTPCSPRLDTFPIYGVTNINGPEEVYDGYQIVHSYNRVIVDFGFDWAFLNREPFYAYVGASIQVGNNNQEIETYIYSMHPKETDDQPHSVIGFGPVLGAEYQVTDPFSVFAEFVRVWSFSEEDNWLKHNEISLGVHYMFNR